MADPNFLAMQTRVKTATKTDSLEPIVVQFIKDSINQAYYDVTRQNDFPELLRTSNAVVTSGTIPNTGVSALLPEFLREERVHFYDVSTTRRHKLVKITEIPAPAPLFGLPTRYQLIFGGLSDPYVTILVEPATLVQFNTDILYVQYYRAPALLSADADLLTSYRLYEEVIRRACVNVHNYKGKVEQARMIWEQTFAAMQKQSSNNQ